MTLLIARSKFGSIKSSSIAIGAAAVFMIFSGILGIASERQAVGTLKSVDWGLRGTIIPLTIGLHNPGIRQI